MRISWILFWENKKISTHNKNSAQILEATLSERDNNEPSKQIKQFAYKFFQSFSIKNINFVYI